MIKCPVCGKELPDDADFCDLCDSELEDEVPTTKERSPQAEALISEALSVVDKEVDVRLGSSSVIGGINSPVIEAANKLEIAHNRHPKDSALYYAWALALELAGKQKEARYEMEILVEEDPDFLLAKFALEGWGRFGESLFRLPPWGRQSSTVHPAISEAVRKCRLLGVRDGITPRAALFVRDVNNSFRDAAALGKAKINLATVISPVTDEALIVMYSRVCCESGDPFMAQTMDMLLYPRGNGVRAKYEYLCMQRNIDFAIFDRNDRLLLNKRLPLTQKMLEANERMLEMLLDSSGYDYLASYAAQAERTHNTNFSTDQISF